MEFVKGPNNSREETLAHMVAQYEVMLLRTCYMYLHDRELAEDAAQETFLKAYRRWIPSVEKAARKHG